MLPYALLLVNSNVTNSTQGSNFDTLADQQGQSKSWDWVQQYCRAWRMCNQLIWNAVILKGTHCRSKFLDKFICWIITFTKAYKVGVISFDQDSSKKNWFSVPQTRYVKWRSCPEQSCGAGICTFEWFDSLGWWFGSSLLPFALFLMPMLSLTTFTNFNYCSRVRRMRQCEYIKSCSDAGDQGWKRRG